MASLLDVLPVDVVRSGLLPAIGDACTLLVMRRVCR
jgi:hypothetical protein